MKHKLICYFETEAQCEAAADALIHAGVSKDAIRIVSDNTKPCNSVTDCDTTIIGSSASFALGEPQPLSDTLTENTYVQAPIATLLIRGDLFTFSESDDKVLGSYAVEVNADADTLDLSRDILLNLF